ncbi:hypothetical protein VTJ04DRAFT_6719 [Mycothermus thermophilus]|uniref:uncharacterized protein n=1 Tax=Humicola insolens TaxID=85995 RepID=UPI003741F07A
MADFNEIATQFVQHYYTTFDTDRAALAGLYRENSLLTFQSAQVAGAPGIAEKLTSLPFTKVVHRTSSVDAQPTANGGIIILVTGQLLVDEEQNPLSFSQSFLLAQDPAGAWYVANDVFTLVYA